MNIQFNPKDFSGLADIMSKGDNVPIDIVHNELFNTVWVQSNSLETEVYLKSGGRERLIVSRIGFNNQHIGTGTKVLEWLKDYALKTGFEGIEVESCSTREMDRFCIKHGFKRVEHCGWEVEDYWFGNYLLELKERV